MDELKQTDPEIYDLIKHEERYEFDSIRLIPSENYVSKAVLQATGSVLANKYSEGYPGRRYYEGQRYVDRIETVVVERAKALFHAEHANVQPYSGSPANLAVYYALAKPAEKLMGLALPHGGHLSHGWGVTLSGSLWTAVPYEVDRESHRIDYDALRDRARLERPRIIIAGTTAYPRQLDFKIFGEIAKEVGAYLLADISHIAGLIVGGVHPDPAPYADVIMTTTHKTLRGPRGAMILCRKELAAQIDRAVFPGLQGGPHNHTTAAIGVALHEAATPAFKDIRPSGGAQRQGAGRRADQSRLSVGLRRNRQSSGAHRPDQPEGDWQESRQGARRRRHRREFQHRALRSAQAVQPQRNPARDAGRHVARDG